MHNNKIKFLENSILIIDILIFILIDITIPIKKSNLFITLIILSQFLIAFFYPLISDKLNKYFVKNLNIQYKNICIYIFVMFWVFLIKIIVDIYFYFFDEFPDKIKGVIFLVTILIMVIYAAFLPNKENQ